ncbi:MAG: ORF6N domain-containing protein [Bacteroidales bacterium]|nr:ORF6N domain-containing protein [Bacteroidales bacterium]
MQKNEIILYQPDDTVKLEVRSKIQIIRGTAVMIDRDLAVLYSVDTKRINEQARRNIERFPDRFRFQLTNEETSQLVAFCDRFKALKHSTANPFAYTEQGVAMLATVLKSETAVKVSIGIMDAFVEMHRLLESTAGLSQRIESLEYRQLKTDHRINELFQFIESPDKPFKEGIFFDGQIFDAYAFVSELIRSAKSSIALIDNYVDESVLLLLSKRAEGVSARIITRKMSESLQLDIEKYSRQYAPIEVVESPRFHDRFLIIDETVYHIGASLKDLGKKLFAFSKMDVPVEWLEP